MSRNPYVRECLPATRNQVCDPSCVVESRLATLSDLSAGWSPHGAGQYAYDLLATLTWLERIKPEFLARLDPEGLVETCRRRLETEGEALVEQALEVPYPQGWLEEAEALRTSCEDLIDPVERAELAYRLINDLDDAELVLLAATRAGLPDPALEEELDQCRAWLAENADAFLAAGVYVQDVGLALRPDLAGADPDLGRTVEKYTHVLDALEELEAECEWTEVPGISPRALGSVLEGFAGGREVRSPSAQYPFRGRFVLSTPSYRWAAQAENPKQSVETCVWESPDHHFQALLTIFGAPSSGDEEPLTITFQEQQDRPALELSGQPVAVGSCLSQIETAGRSVVARFRWGELKQQDELRLFVGTEKVEWSPVADPFAA
jgi:hypothetical protein